MATRQVLALEFKVRVLARQLPVHALGSHPVSLPPGVIKFVGVNADAGDVLDAALRMGRQETRRRQ